MELSNESKATVKQRLLDAGAHVEGVTTEQAIETYDRTLRDVDYMGWPNWIRAVALALDTHDTADLVNYPAFAMEVYKEKSTNRSISFADELK